MKRVTTRSLDDFMAQMLERAAPIDSLSLDVAPIGKAAKHLNWQADKIIRLVMNGKVPLFCLRGRQDFDGLCVDRQDFRWIMSAPAMSPCLSKKKAAAELGVDVHAIELLMRVARTRVAKYWLLYLVKAAHIAVLVEMIHGRPLPPGSGQIGYGQSVVRERFGEASALFVLDGLVRAALRMINRLTMGFLLVLPDKLARQIAFAVNTVLYFAIGLIDEIILAHAINNRSTDAWGSAADALALYRQNWKAILKNALWLTLFAVALGWLLYTFLFEPAQAAYTLDPETGRRGYFLSIAISSLILATYFGPFALISMLQVWFRLIAAQPVAPRARAEVGRIAPSLTAMGGPRVPLRTVGTNGPRNGDLI